MPAPEFPKMEEDVLRFWEKEKIFEKTLAKKSPKGDFVFYEGPPTANGKPGIHHIEARAFKDILPRYKTMRGYRVERKAGWDTHGLPVELGVEKALGISGKQQIESLKETPTASIAYFNAECRKSVWTYLEDWKRMTKRIGFWLDMEHPYVTYETPYIESLWAIMKQVWDKGLLFKDYKIVPYCPRCGTALSSHEVAQGYKEVTEPSVTVKMRATPKQTIALANHKRLTIDERTYFLVWTTTPWTLPANTGLAVGPEIRYLIAKKDDATYIVALELADRALGAGYEEVATVSGEDLRGLTYAPLFSYLPAENAHRVITAEFVSVADGTGIVHIAPAFGEDDMQVGRANGLPLLMTVAEDGTFIPEITDWAGLFVKDADPKIIAWLEAHGALWKQEDYTHDYPFCWRCSTPLLYFAKESWWIRMTDLRDKLIAANDTVSWEPAYIKDGRFGEWLRGVKDWAFSRERYWGTPLPIWECGTCAERTCVGSVAELKQLAGRLPMNGDEVDLHRPFVDELAFPCAKGCGGEMRRVKEVADVWFDSGAMPFAQWGYPHAKGSEKALTAAFPADFISEAIDQTRGWFYTLLAVSVLMDRGAPYKNVICLGHVLDKHNKKMSKSKGNVVDPFLMIEKYGADCIRLYMYSVNQPGDAKRFDEADLAELQRKFFLILWNVLTFYKTYAGIGSPNSKLQAPDHVLDRWILSRLAGLTKQVADDLDRYRVTEPSRLLLDFVTDLSTWYVRRSRDRFKEDGSAAAATLGHVLREFAKLLAPFAPFTAEALWKELGGTGSVHLEDWPGAETVDEQLLLVMSRARDVVSLGLEQRASAKLNVRQPLAKATLIGTAFDEDITDIIRDELNVLVVEQRPGDPVAVTLDTDLTPELKRAGALREMTRHVQALRKKAGLTVGDSIFLSYEATGAIAEMLVDVEEELETAVRAKDVSHGKADLPHAADVLVHGEKVWIGIEKA